MTGWRVCPNQDPGGQSGNWHLIGVAGNLPFILLTAGMSAWGSDNILPIRLNVEARPKYTFSTADGLGEVPEEMMRPPAAGETDRRLGELVVLSFELIKGQITIIPWVLIKDNDSTGRSRCDPHVGIRILFPPLLNPLGIGGGIFDATSKARVFPWEVTIRLATGALPVS